MVFDPIDRYYGNGGTNRVFLGYGYRFPFKLSLGAEIAYVFGGIDNNVLNRRNNVQLATQNLQIRMSKELPLSLERIMKLKLVKTLVLNSDWLPIWSQR